MTARIFKETTIAHTSFFLWSVCAIAVLGIVCSFPRTTQAEYIDSFVSDIVLNADATFSVTETITYIFDGSKHGIFRCIPALHQEPASSFVKERYIDVDLTRIMMDGGEVPYTDDTNGNELCIKIGDPNKTVMGSHVYTVAYTVGGGLSYQAYGGAELYWNVTGNGWDVPMKTVRAHISSSEGILLKERACYQGETGKSDSCASTTEDQGVVQFEGRPLNPHEGLTIAQAVDRTKIPIDIRERFKSIWIWGALLALILGGGGTALYRYKTKFKTGRAIIPQYEPYPGVKPMYSGFLFDKRLDPRDITAGIVYLAEQGFLKIRKVERKVLFLFEVDDYEMTLMKPMSEISDVFEKGIVELIFKDNSEVGHTITLHELQQSNRGQENGLKILALGKQLKQDLKDQGYFVGFNASSVFSTASIISLLLIAGLFYFISSVALIFGVVAMIVVGIILSEGRRTQKGYEALDYLKGFREFLSVTEKERYIFHNAPEKNAVQFMEYLPYAIAFGVEKEWAKTFEGITIPNPNWYDGGTHISTFNAVALTNSLGAFSTSLGASSGVTASGGGGHSGGGGGGGGGGSW